MANENSDKTVRADSLYQSISNKINYGEFEKMMKILEDDMLIYKTDDDNTYTYIGGN